MANTATSQATTVAKTEAKSLDWKSIAKTTILGVGCGAAGAGAGYGAFRGVKSLTQAPVAETTEAAVEAVAQLGKYGAKVRDAAPYVAGAGAAIGVSYGVYKLAGYIGKRFSAKKDGKKEEVKPEVAAQAAA